MRGGWLIVGAAALALVLSRPAGADDAPKAGHPAAAAEKVADEAGKHAPAKGDSGHGGHGEHKKRTPFDPALDLTLWSIVVFALMLGVLWKFAWKPILAGLQAREQAIQSALDQAERTRRETMELQARLEADRVAAGQKVAAVLEEARRDAQSVRDQMVGQAKAEIQAERDRMHREIDTAKDQALKELWEQSVTLAAMLSAKTIKRELGPEDHRRLLDESLGELKAAGLSGKRI